MLHIRPIHDSAELTEGFIRFGVEHPGRFACSMPRVYEKEAALVRPDKNFFFKTGIFRGWVALNNDRVVGRIGAMINPEMHVEKEGTGLVGLFEAEPEYDITRRLLDAAVLFLKGSNCTYIWGPMNFSIWQGYRFKTDCFDDTTFIGEPQNPQYYPSHFEKYGFQPAQEWESQIIDRAGMEALCLKHQEQFELFTKLGYWAERLNYKQHMHICYELILHIFKEFPGFFPIDENDLLGLYEGLPHLLEKRASFLFKDCRGDNVGFALVLKEAIAAMQAMEGKTDIVAKIKFMLNISKAETVSFFLTGFKYTTVREVMARGKESGTRLSIGRAVLHLTLREALESQRYQYALLPLMRQEVPARNLVKKLAVKTMHHRMFGLDL